MVNHRWALVTASGFINHGTMCFTRRDVIREYLTDFAEFRSRHHPGLTDAQFWRLMKRNRGFSVRRIVLKVAR